MEELQGAFGTAGSLALRLGQALFGVASLLFMCLDTEFYSFSAFSFLVTIMGLVVPWSFTLALVDMYSVCAARRVRPVGIFSVVIIGDWVLSLLSLAASCSAASVSDFLVTSRVPLFIKNICTKYQLGASTALMSWTLLFASSLFNLWLLVSM